MGDWNSNAIWDQERKNGNHSHIVDFLLKYDIASVYHELRQENHGEELKPTLFLLKNKNKPYHIDYCFVPRYMITEKTTIKVGDFDQWIKLSDHMPITIDNLGK